MKYRSLLLISLVAFSISLTGCDRVRGFFGKKAEKPATEETTATDPASSETAPAAGGEAASSATTADSTPAAAGPTPVAINRNATVVVLCYHRFEDNPRDDLAISPEEFRKQLQTLKDNDIAVISAEDLLAWRRGEKNIPARSAVITIDDGYISGYSVAWPILKEFGYPFTMFVYIDYIGSGGKAITWEQLGEMRDGGVDIQSHTYSHKSLRGNKPAEFLHREIAESKKMLEQQLAIRVNTLAYPYGQYSQAARDKVKDAGYDAAFTVYGQKITFASPAIDILGRYAIGSRKPEIFDMAVKAALTASPESEQSGPSIAQVAAASMVTQPMDGETISNATPIIRANLATMGNIDPATIEMRVSGIGLVKANYDPASKTLTYQVEQPLTSKTYTVILSAMMGETKVETRWSFNFDASAAKQ